MRFALAVLLLAVPGAAGQDPDVNDRLLQVLEKRHRETPDPADARAAAGRLGFDRAKILDFVAGLSWEPYAGVLRDSSGTLLCGGGNSLDRALLLQGMLEAGGEKTRLMRSDLGEADGARLLDAFRKRTTKPRVGADPKALALELGVDPGGLEAAVTARRREEAELVEEILDAAKAEAARVAPLVGPVGGRAAAASKEHVWVQVWDGGRRDWLDLDPSPVEVARTKPRSFLPQEVAAQRRAVTIRLIMNRKTGAKVEPVSLLNVPSDLSAISWKAADFVVQPLHGELPHGSKVREMDAKARLEAFRQVKRFRGGLIIDGKYFGGIPFDLSGRTYDVDAGGRVGPAQALASGLGKAFGGAFGGGGQEAAPSGLESLVLEVGVKEPGSPERVHRRTLYAPAKPGERLSPLPVLRYSFLVDGAPLPEGERGRRAVVAFAKNAPALRRLFKGEFEGIHFNPHAEVSSLLLRFGELRRRALLRLGDGSAPIQDRPGICAETSQVLVDESEARMVVRRGIDILDNPVRFESGASTLAYGMAETVLECLLVVRKWPGDSRLSAWSSIERARLQGGKMEMVERDGRKEVRWSPSAWWSIDPVGGTCVGRVPSGAGQGMVEAAWEHASAVCNYSDVVGLAAGAGSATGVTGKMADDAADYFGKACGVVGGTWPRDVAGDKVKELTKDLWPGAIAALSGM